MSQSINVNFRMDADIKTKMEQICSEMGLNMTTAFNIFAKTVIRERRIPFEISADPFYDESNQKYLKSLYDKVKKGEAHFEEHTLEED